MSNDRAQTTPSPAIPEGDDVGRSIERCRAANSASIEAFREQAVPLAARMLARLDGLHEDLDLFCLLDQTERGVEREWMDPIAGVTAAMLELLKSYSVGAPASAFKTAKLREDVIDQLRDDSADQRAS